MFFKIINGANFGLKNISSKTKVYVILTGRGASLCQQLSDQCEKYSLLEFDKYMSRVSSQMNNIVNIMLIG